MKANSQWGYMAMNSDRVRHKIIANNSKLFDMLTDDQYIIHNIVPNSNDQFVQVYYSVISENNDGGLNTNVAEAAFVTAYARMRLYKEIEKLERRVLYFDTDSIFFISREGEYEPELGNYLGDFTNEIDQKEGNYIEEFVSAGPKNYAYKLDTGITHCTVKGFTLNNLANLTVNYDSIKDIVCNDRNKKLVVDQQSFKIDNKNWIVKSMDVEKMYGFVYDKRVLLEDLTTLPYGF
jgi:hypothetical protein